MSCQIDAYNVKLVDDDGKLTVRTIQVRENPDQAMKDYTDTYIRAARRPPPPPGRIRTTTSPFHNKTIVMTHNFTISIAAKMLDDSNNAALTPNSARSQEEL